ncbi:MAG: metal-dependent transcriptional regulator [Anaerotignum sp.]|nr:metal-dependent transcriptional regulator [Anaerotignum sp.]
MHESGENYLKEILIIQMNQGLVRSIDIAQKFGYSRPSISVAMKNLKENHYIIMDDDKVIKLTDLGEEKARNVFQKYFLIERFLILVLQVDEKTASQDACKMEHRISDETFKQMQLTLTKMTEVNQKP